MGSLIEVKVSLFPVIELKEHPGNPEQLGTKEKFWIEHDNRLHLLKFGREGTGEDWAEKVACELCCLLGIPHAHYDLAKYNGRCGVLTPSIVKDGERLILGNELINSVSSGYDSTVSYRQREHTVTRVLAALARFTSNKEDSQCIFSGYLLLDAWIGNTDRHHENWGLINHEGTRVSLAPTFDHASSLGRELPDRVRSERLATKDTRFSVEAFSEKARSAIYENQHDRKPLSTVAAFMSVASKLPKKCGSYWVEKLETIPVQEIDSIFSRIPDEFISAPSRGFATRILHHNRTRILREWEKSWPSLS
nr:HipA domain-containing protein [uncultured Shinella sp.]